MTITIALSDEDGGTRLVALHEGLPPGVSAVGNQAGWNESRARLASLVEERHATSRAGRTQAERTGCPDE